MNLAQIAVDGIEKLGVYESWYFEGDWYTNAQMVNRGSRLATVLKEKGVQPGDRVLVMMESCMDVPDSFHAIARIGAVTVPIMPQLIPREVRYIVENSGTQTVLKSPRRLKELIAFAKSSSSVTVRLREQKTSVRRSTMLNPLPASTTARTRILRC